MNQSHQSRLERHFSPFFSAVLSFPIFSCCLRAAYPHQLHFRMPFLPFIVFEWEF